jgi:hypothetical protein
MNDETIFFSGGAGLNDTHLLSTVHAIEEGIIEWLRGVRNASALGSERKANQLPGHFYRAIPLPHCPTLSIFLNFCHSRVEMY